MATKTCTPESIAAFLRNGPANAAAIVKALGTSQPVFSRNWANTPNGITIGESRARQYAIRRQIQGVESVIPVYQVSVEGKINDIGDLTPLEGNSYVFHSPDGSNYKIYRGLPFFLSDLKPQGFLGRSVPRNHQDLGLPENILTWTDDDVLRYLVNRGKSLPGNLVLGNPSYVAFLRTNNELNWFDVCVDSDKRATAYPFEVERAITDGSPGSSAGGEQPKFVVILDDTRNLIVKFSPPMEELNGRRWADLLACEHIAMDTLNDNAIPAATSTIFDAGGRRYLEVDRFDRKGRAGRLPMITMSGLDGNLGLLDQKWTKVASVLYERGQLSSDDRALIEVLDLYGALIGNTDRHHGNIAFSWDQEENLRLLPVYDMLPMFYRPNQHGEVRDKIWAPVNIESLVLRHLPLALDLARQFWARVVRDSRISEQFEAVAAAHVDALRHLDT